MNDVLRWRKARRSSAMDGCVEIAVAGDNTIAVRDSRDPRGPIIEVPLQAWHAFLAKINVSAAS